MSKIQEWENFNVSRRDFLKAGLVLIGGCFYRPLSTEPSNLLAREENNFPWLESDEDAHGHSAQWHMDNIPDVMTERELDRFRSYTPLRTGRVSMSDISSHILAEAGQRLRKEWNLAPSAPIQIGRTSSRHLLVPAPEKAGKSLEDYCEKAVEFMNEHIKGLQTPKIEWETVPPDCRVSRLDLQNKGIVGHSHYAVYLIEAGTPVKDRNGNVHVRYKNYEMFDFRRSSFMEHYPEPDSDAIAYWHVFIGSCMPVIREPFSEVIPFTTIPAAKEYGKKHGQLAGAIADETIAEAMSYHLGLAIADKLKIPNGRRLLEESIRTYKDQAQLQFSKSRYTHVPRAIVYISEKGGFPRGVQLAFDTYMNNVEQFMQEINNFRHNL